MIIQTLPVFGAGGWREGPQILAACHTHVLCHRDCAAVGDKVHVLLSRVPAVPRDVTLLIARAPLQMLSTFKNILTVFCLLFVYVVGGKRAQR